VDGRSRIVPRLPPDPLLPGLTLALDPATISGHLRRAGLAGAVLEAEPVRYRPGLRCTIRYRQSTAAGHRDLYGKVFATGASQIAHTSAALARASTADTRLPLMMPVVAMVDELSLVVYEACAGALEFHPVAVDDRVASRTRCDRWIAVGRAVAALHASTLASLPPYRSENDLAELAAGQRAMAHHDDALARRFGATVDQLARHLAGDTNQTGPTHGALRTDQILLAGKRVALLDLDGACLANPARDLGNLIAYLEWKVVRGVATAPTVAAGINHLLTGYADGGGATAADALACYRAAAMLKIVARRFIGEQTAEWELARQLQTAAEQLVA
jgi:aminoglycoside phosphotransferase (APT) family kinase protein